MPNCDSWRFVDVDVTVSVSVNSTNVSVDSYGNISTTKITGSYELSPIKANAIPINGGAIKCTRASTYIPELPEGYCEFYNLPSTDPIPLNFWQYASYFALKGTPTLNNCAGFSGLTAYLPYVPKPGAVSINTKVTDPSGNVISNQTTTADGKIMWESIYLGQQFNNPKYCHFSGLDYEFQGFDTIPNDNLLPLFGFSRNVVYIRSCDVNEQGSYDVVPWTEYIDTHLPSNPRFGGVARGVMWWDNVYHTNQTNHPVYYTAYVPGGPSEGVPIEIRDGAVATIGEPDEPSVRIEIKISKV